MNLLYNTPFPQGGLAMRASDQLLMAEFMNLAEKWVEETKDIRNTEKYFDRNYAKIVEMGDRIIPILLDEIVRELGDPKGQPSKWFWALKLITGDNPVPERFRNEPNKAASCWLHWGKTHGFETEIPED